MIFTYILIGLAILILLANVIILNLVLETRNKLLKPVINDDEQLRLQFAAYERLALLAERSSLSALVSRTESVSDAVADLHIKLIDSLKEEYDHNISQQIYVSSEVWNAITRLKDQNIYVINQLAATLPPGSSSADLKKRILEYTMEESADLSKIVLDAIRFETNKLL